MSNGDPGGCVFALGVYAVASVALYFMTYYALSAFDVSQPHLSALSLLVGFSGAIAAHWFLSTMD